MQDVINKAYKKKLSYKYLSNIRSCLMAMMKYARKSRVANLKPEFLYIPKGAKKGKKEALKPDDISKLFATNKTTYRNNEIDEWFIFVYRFYVLTGLRRGELIALKNNDICGNVLSINRSVNRFREITDGKNENAQREIALPLLAVKVLNDQREMLEKFRLKSEYIFPDKYGDMINPEYLYKRWTIFRNYNNISDRTIYELSRHTFISICKGQIDEQSIKEIVGHSSSMDTFGNYGHKFDDGRYDKVSAKINSLYERILLAG